MESVQSVFRRGASLTCLSYTPRTGICLIVRRLESLSYTPRAEISLSYTPRSGICLVVRRVRSSSYTSRLETPQWGAADAEIKSHLVRTQSLNVLPLKPGVGRYIAIHTTLTASDFFLAYYYPPGPFTCIFPKSLLISPVMAVANTWFLCRPAE